MSVVIAHTAAPPYLRETARVLHEADLLRLAVIGLATRDDDLWMRAISSIPGLGQLHALFRRKRFEEVPRAKLRRRGRYELARLVCGRLDRLGIATDYLWDQGTKRFDRYSASVLRPGDTAYGYEYGCLAFLNKPGNLATPRCTRSPVRHMTGITIC
ncbi:MAG: hypothetical protein IPK97_06850 [Ahniella sp.]|nr:hypothetical protein [Ahniella sp.]